MIIDNYIRRDWLLIQEEPLKDDFELDESREDDYRQIMDKIIKINREIFMLSALSERSMCGYDLIKEIFHRCDVFLSQGSVYPILYSLEEEGILQAEFNKGDMRTKKYSFTPKGRQIAQKKLDEFTRAMEEVLALIKG